MNIFFLTLCAARPGNRVSSNIFLYILVISDGFQVPVYSMLSEAHNSNMITFWLNEWIRFGGMIPQEFICDMSLALLNAGVRAFTKEGTIHDYVNNLFSLIHSQENRIISPNKIPACFIRIDFAHLMKNITGCKALQNKPLKVKDFYVRCITILIKTDSLNDARGHIKSVLMLLIRKLKANRKTTEIMFHAKFTRKKLSKKLWVFHNQNFRLIC